MRRQDFPYSKCGSIPDIQECGIVIPFLECVVRAGPNSIDGGKMGNDMSEKDVVEAFLSQEPAENSPLATDGGRLCINEEVIAEWSEDALIVTPRKQGALHEQLKDRLVHNVLLRMAGQQPAYASRRVPAGVGAR
jgi:hypothetical protein